jgi:TFIIF-interacting CTD phosphatase-like protein
MLPNCYLKPRNNQMHKYSLVLDLDETLIHYDGQQFLVRPFAHYFLKMMSKKYEIIIFTAAQKDVTIIITTINIIIVNLYLVCQLYPG